MMAAGGCWGTGLLSPAAANWGTHLLRLCVGVACGVIVFAHALVLRLPELRWLLARGGGSAGPVSMESVGLRAAVDLKHAVAGAFGTTKRTTLPQVGQRAL